MIREILTYLSERPKLHEARSFGHLVESISLLSREKRCQKSWLPHRTECKNFIADHMSAALHFESVLILGSGPLHEIPIELLSKTFKKVVLVDIVHLKSIKQSLYHLKNIQFIEHEISEIENLLKKEKKLITKIPTTFLDEHWGLILSVNIMSQLPIHLDSYIKKRLKNKFNEADVDDYLKEVTANHLRYLQSFKAPVILITDTEKDYYDKKDIVLETDKNYTHLKLPPAINEWTWNVAPIPEFQKDLGIRMRVSGFVLNK